MRKITGLVIASILCLGAASVNAKGFLDNTRVENAIVSFSGFELNGCEIIFQKNAAMHINGINRYFKKKNGIEVVYNGRQGEDYVSIILNDHEVDDAFDEFVKRRNKCSFSPFN